MKIFKHTHIIVAVLLLAAGLRLIGITNPLIGHHSWRQADTAAVARNFVQERFDVLYPRVDWRGTSSGEVECEFPVYQFMVASLYRLFGVREIVGRLLSIVFSLAAIFGVYLLSKHIAGVAVGLWSAFFLAVLPMPIFFGRVMMPESLLLAACVYSVFLFLKWTKTDSPWHLLLSAICLSIACLLKPPTLYLGLPLGYLAFRKHRFKTVANPCLWLFAILLFGSLSLWYFHAHRFIDTTGLTFGVWEYGSDKWGNWGLVSSTEFWKTIFIERIPRFLLSYLGVPLLVLGLVRPAHSDQENALRYWFVGMFIFVIIVAKGVFVHDYYLLPASIPAAYFMGKAAAWGVGLKSPVFRWVQVIILICICGTVGVSLRTYHKWLKRETPRSNAAFQAAQVASEILPRNSLVVAVDKGDPTILYYSHMKGWRSFPYDLSEGWIDDRVEDGAKYIIGVHEDFRKYDSSDKLSRLINEHKVVTNNGVFFIVCAEK